MPSDKLKRWLIESRAWEIFVLLQKLPDPHGGLLADLDEQIYLAALTDSLRLQILWPSLNKKLVLRETYSYSDDQLTIDSYGYALIEIGKRVIIRADSASYHERDYRRKPLARFPHHLHDEKKRVRSFSGNFEDFVELIVPYFRRK
jgi:hypothetical protein